MKKYIVVLLLVLSACLIPQIDWDPGEGLDKPIVENCIDCPASMVQGVTAYQMIHQDINQVVYAPLEYQPLSVESTGLNPKQATLPESFQRFRPQNSLQAKYHLYNTISKLNPEYMDQHIDATVLRHITTQEYQV